MIRVQQIRVPLNHSRDNIEHKIRKILNLKKDREFTFEIQKQSIDARRGKEAVYVYTADADLGMRPEKEKKFVEKIHNNNIMLTNDKPYHFFQTGTASLRHRPVIAGSGPAGMFCAYLLALHGYHPVILERGKTAEERRQDVEQFWKDGILNPGSNVQFGEGGAGTFSDGKLNTLVKDPSGRNRFVLETFVRFGADSSILYVNKPHIGTDMLTGILENMREEIIRLGGTFYFETCLTDFEVKNDRVCSVTVESPMGRQQIPADVLILAIGHSARDTYEMLLQKQVPMQAKAFAVGLRIEHPQSMINELQYHGADMRYLPAASYKVSASMPDGRGVYSFCMCPGGYVVNASSEEGRLAINGMSYHKRDGKNANSAVIAAVTPQDYARFGNSPLAGIAFQRELEERAFKLGNGKIVQQLYGDYKEGRISSGYGDFASQTKGESTFADLNTLLPQELGQALIAGMERFDTYIHGFNRPDAILSGIESRTSSPVRILRDEQFQSAVRGIFPCGEGAGYAGGIMSAAMDGMKAAEAIGALWRF